MKNKVSRQLLDYWNAQRGERRLPARNQIVPGEISSILGDTFMLTRDADPIFRLAGTRICEMFGRELKGTVFTSLWDARSHRMLRGLLDELAEENLGAVAAVIGATDEGAPVTLEMLLLPLGGGGATEPRSIGTLVPMSGTPRPELQSVSGLALGTWRLVGPQLEEILVPRFPEAPLDIPARPTLVVHRGGRV
jgi:hypothetical protein